MTIISLIQRRPVLSFMGIKFDPFWWVVADTKAAEVISALCLMMWALHLAMTPDLFEASVIYRPMLVLFEGASWAEYAWAGIFGSGWLLQSLAMCGHVSKLRFPSALIAMVLWTVLAGMLTFALPSLILGKICIILAAVMLWVVVKGPTGEPDIIQI